MSAQDEQRAHNRRAARGRRDVAGSRRRFRSRGMTRAPHAQDSGRCARFLPRPAGMQPGKGYSAAELDTPQLRKFLLKCAPRSPRLFISSR